MLNFLGLIVLIIPVLGFYIPTYFSLKSKIDDYTETQTEIERNKNRIDKTRKRIKSLNIITIILILIILILYYLPLIIEIFNKITLSSNIENFLSKYLPFKNGFFADSNFKFSYITGIVLSIVSEIVLIYILFLSDDVWYFNDSVWYYILSITILIIFPYFLIWINYFISLSLSLRITDYFELLSIAINIFTYCFMTLIVLLIMMYLLSFILKISDIISDIIS